MKKTNLDILKNIKDLKLKQEKLLCELQFSLTCEDILKLNPNNYPYMKALTKKYKKNKQEPLGEILHWRKSDCRERYKN